MPKFLSHETHHLLYILIPPLRQVLHSIQYQPQSYNYAIQSNQVPGNLDKSHIPKYGLDPVEVPAIKVGVSLS
jgi:hypothetical protein